MNLQILVPSLYSYINNESHWKKFKKKRTRSFALQAKSSAQHMCYKGENLEVPSLSNNLRTQGTGNSSKSAL